MKWYSTVSQLISSSKVGSVVCTHFCLYSTACHTVSTKCVRFSLKADSDLFRERGVHTVYCRLCGHLCWCVISTKCVRFSLNVDSDLSRERRSYTVRRGSVVPSSQYNIRDIRHLLYIRSPLYFCVKYIIPTGTVVLFIHQPPHQPRNYCTLVKFSVWFFLYFYNVVQTFSHNKSQ